MPVTEFDEKLRNRGKHERRLLRFVTQEMGAGGEGSQFLRLQLQAFWFKKG